MKIRIALFLIAVIVNSTAVIPQVGTKFVWISSAILGWFFGENIALLNSMSRARREQQEILARRRSFLRMMELGIVNPTEIRDDSEIRKCWKN